MSVDIFLEAKDVKNGAPTLLRGHLFYDTMDSCSSLIHAVVLRSARTDWVDLGGLIVSELKPYISKGHPPLIIPSEEVDSKDHTYSKWQCHIPYLYSAPCVKELDDLLTKKEEIQKRLDNGVIVDEIPWHASLVKECQESYDRLSRFPNVRLRGEEFNALLQKLTAGIKDRLISLGCTIFHDFNEKETEEN